MVHPLSDIYWKGKRHFIDFHQMLTTNDTFIKRYTFQDRVQGSRISKIIVDSDCS